MQYRWTMAPGAARSGGTDDDGNDPNGSSTGVLHYGVALAKAVGMPSHILSHARGVADMLEREQHVRIEAAAAAGDDGGEGGAGGGGGGGGGGGSSARVMREVYSLVHRLGCVMRQSGVDVESRSTGGAGSQQEAEGGDGGGGGAVAQSAVVDAATLAGVLPLLRELKGEAERLCFR